MKGSPSLFRKMSPLLWCNCNWPPCTGHSPQREDKGGCRAGRLLACGLVNPTINGKTTKQNGTMTKAHQDQRTSKSNSITSSAQHESHCSRFFTGVTAPIVVQFAASKVIGRRTHEFSKCFRGHSTHGWTYTRYTGTRFHRLSNHLTHSPSTCRRDSGLHCGNELTWPLEIWE